MSGERGPWTHHMSEDGCTLVIEEVRPEGVYKTTTEWSTAGEAEANVERALKMYAENEIGTQLNMPGQKQTAHRIGPLIVSILSGPPTWWSPRFKIKREYQQIMVGWLRRGYVVSWAGWRKR